MAGTTPTNSWQAPSDTTQQRWLGKQPAGGWPLLSHCCTLEQPEWCVLTSLLGVYSLSRAKRQHTTQLSIGGATILQVVYPWHQKIARHGMLHGAAALKTRRTFAPTTLDWVPATAQDAARKHQQCPHAVQQHECCSTLIDWRTKRGCHHQPNGTLAVNSRQLKV